MSGVCEENSAATREVGGRPVTDTCRKQHCERMGSFNNWSRLTKLNFQCDRQCQLSLHFAMANPEVS